MAAAVRGDTTSGAEAARSVGMHLSTDLPATPTGSDTKSTAIATTLNSMTKTGKKEIRTLNKSVDQLREGMAAAPRRIDAADQQGAAEVDNSGTVTV
jgi:hypothetical protein